MRLLLLLLSLTLFVGCKIMKLENKETAEAAPQPPVGLEGPAYDPASSPVPMSSSTPMPVPAGTVPTMEAQGTPGDLPGTYQSAPLYPSQASKGDPAAPASYGSTAPAAAPSTYSPAPNSAEAQLASVLTGMWVNSADNQEIVEFTPDHYTTYYNGEMLFQEAMTYHANCPGACNAGIEMEIACFTISGPGGTDCYGIIRLTPDVLEMSMLGVSTETILYNKQL
ncbi:hypothetical protein [Neolewinella persica]|uniref:hypothetical protein n=1 Tax=Neolewinella persica TaxID=70998 RepID=UPI00037B15DE|nr:hypothetical protein [Neolewinella persica]